MELDEKVITIEDGNGVEHKCTIVFTYENENRNTKYVFFYEDDESEVICMRYNDNGELEDIEDEEEYNEVSEVFDAYESDEEIAKIK